jgi:hypothetical protein
MRFEAGGESKCHARSATHRLVLELTRHRRIVSEENDQPDIDVTGLRKVYDWVEQDAGKTVLMSGIQTVGAKAWE